MVFSETYGQVGYRLVLEVGRRVLSVMTELKGITSVKEGFLEVGT